MRAGMAATLQSGSSAAEGSVLILFLGSKSAYTCNRVNLAWPLCSRWNCCVSAH